MSDKRTRPIRYTRAVGALGAALLAPAALLAAPGIVPPAQLAVGRNLEAFTFVKLTEQAPEAGLQLTIASDDPSRLLFSARPDQAGTKSITLKLNAQYVQSPDFYLQALADSGTATYTVTAPGFGSAHGTVTLSPSAILIAGPSKSSAFRTTPAMAARITLFSVMLDTAGHLVAQQPVAGGLSINAAITSSNAKAGSVADSSLRLAGGEASASTDFKPTGVGATTLAVTPPSGFTLPAEMGSVAITVDLPGMGLTGEVTIGKDLEMPGSLILGEAAPSEGLDITLTSSDPQKLVLSKDENQLGSGSLTIHLDAGQTQAVYYLQGLGDSGLVSYTAKARGYHDRVAPIQMAPSGVMLAYASYGFGSRTFTDFPPFNVSLAEKKPITLSLWCGYLDPNTRIGADATTQKLRPGKSITVNLKSSDPAVGKVVSSVTITSVSDHSLTEFTPLSAGQTVISVTPPTGFAMPANSTSLKAVVNQ